MLNNLQPHTLSFRLETRTTGPGIIAFPAGIGLGVAAWLE